MSGVKVVDKSICYHLKDTNGVIHLNFFPFQYVYIDKPANDEVNPEDHVDSIYESPIKTSPLKSCTISPMKPIEDKEMF